MAPLYVKQHDQPPPTFVKANNGEESEPTWLASFLGVIGWCGQQVLEFMPVLPTLYPIRGLGPSGMSTSMPPTRTNWVLDIDEVEEEKSFYGNSSDMFGHSAPFAMAESSLVRTTGYLGLRSLTWRVPGAKATKLMTAAVAIFFSDFHWRISGQWVWLAVLPVSCVSAHLSSVGWTSLLSWTQRKCRTIVLGPLASSLTFLFLPMLVSQTVAAPIPPPPDFNDSQMTLLAYVSPWIPLATFLYTCGHLAYLFWQRMPADGYKPPKTSWAVAVVMAGIWVVIRTTKEDIEAITLAAFLSPWAIFMGKSVRLLKSKKNYLIVVVLASGSGCLPVTYFSCSACPWDEFWHLYATMGPGLLIGTSLLVYFLWSQGDRILLHRHND